MSISLADESLLKRWFNERDADAFKVLCSRHAGMVYGTCVRILRNETEAEDVVQSCFESLSELRKRPRVPLGPWLHRVATNRALDVLKSDQRRKAREERFSEARELHTDILWEDIYDFVDEAIEELPEKLRVALVAHFIEDQTHECIAKREGVSRAAVTQRIQRGIENIRRALKRRGIPVTSTALGAMLATEKALAVPSSLTASLGKLAIVGMKSQAAAAIVPGGWTAGGRWAVPGAKVAMAVIVVGLAGFALFLARIQGQSNAVTQSEPPVAEESVETDPEVQASEAQTANAENAVGAVAALADPTAEEPPLVLSVASADSPLDLEPDQEDSTPTSSISGYVIDEHGEAVGGASVVVGFHDDLDGGLDPQRAIGRLENQYRTLTDSEGQFQVTGIRHKEWAKIFVEADGMQGANGTMLSPGDSIEGLEIILNEGVQLLGRILSPEGEPVPGAYIKVVACTPRYGEDLRMDFTLCDEAGNFQLIFSRPCLAYLVVRSAAGDALFEAVSAGADGIVDLRLEEPAMVFGTVSSSDGKPAEGLHVRVKSPPGVGYGVGHLPDVWGTGIAYEAVTDETGSYEIAGVFPDSTYQIMVQTDSEQEISPKRKLGDLISGQSLRQDIALEPMMHITGVVVGKTDGRPVHAVGVALISGTKPLHSPEPALSTLVDYQGRFDMHMTVDPGSYVVTPYYEYTSVAVAAEAFGQTVHLDHGNTTELKLTIDQPFSVTLRVVDREGNPVPKVYISPFWRFEDGGMGWATDWSPDADGLFSWDGFAPFGSYTLSALSRGYLQVESRAFEGRPGQELSLGTIVLYRSAGIEGVAVDENGNPMGNVWLTLRAHMDDLEFEPIELKTKGDGRFSTKDQLPATIVRIDASTSRDSLTWSSDVVEFLPDSILDFGEIVLKKP